MTVVNYVCDVCDHIDSTVMVKKPITNGKYHCSLCHPSIGRWHGAFARQRYNSKLPMVFINRTVETTFGRITAGLD